MEEGNTKRVFIWLVICALVIQIVPVNIAGDNWTQTTQEDFEGGETWNTNVTLSPGNVTLDLNPDWWDSNWKYRIPVNITENSGDDLTDFQVPVEIDTKSLIDSGKMRPDLGDIRFIDPSGQELPYWIEVNDNLSYDEPTDYIASWRFDEGTGTTAYDESVNNNDGTINGANWTTGKFGTALEFDGVDDSIDAGNDSSLNITQNLTIEAWVKLSELSRYNTILSKGSYSLKVGPDNKAIFSARNFTTGENWTEVEDTAETYIYSLAVFNRYLYAGTYPNGKIYRTSDGLTWTEVEDTSEQYIYSLAVFNEFLYAGTGSNGTIYRSNDGTIWTEVEDTSEIDIYAFAVFNDYLYAGTYPNGKIYRSSDGNTWTEVEDTVESYIHSLGVFNGYLYAGSSPNGKIYRSSDGNTWTEVEDTAESTIFSFAVFNGYLYAGSSPNGKIYRSSDGTTWVEVEDTTESTIFLSVVNGYLYAGTYYSGKIYRSSDGVTWVEVEDTTEGGINSLAVFNGYLYAGTYSDGKIYRMGGGLDLYSNYNIPFDEWVQVMVTYDGNTARIYLNGNLDSTLKSQITIDTNTLNLLIGNSYGSTIGGFSSTGEENFNGTIDEVRIYDRALSAEEIRAIYHEKSRIWINVSSLLASQITKIYMYYGNPLASGQSDFDATFTKDYGEEGLMGLWHMDEGSGIMTNDSSGNGNHGTLVNGPIWENEDGGQWGERNDVKFLKGSALQFDGIDDYLDVQSSVSLNLDNEITLEAWLKPLADGWKYKRPLSLIPATPSSNFQIKVEIDPSDFNYSRAKNDGGDIRFFDMNGNMLNYWIENWNITGTSIVWVNITTTGTSTVNMYYGNPSAVNASNGSATFEFFEDFDKGLDEWYNFGSPSPSTYQNSEFYDGWGYTTNGDANYDSGSWTKALVNMSKGIILEYRVRQKLTGVVWFDDIAIGMGAEQSGYSETNLPIYFEVWIFGETGQNNEARYRAVGVTEFIEPNDGEFHNIKIKYNGDNHSIEFYSDNILKHNGTMDPRLYNELPVVIRGREIANGNMLDYVFTRKFNIMESIATLGNETAAGISEAGSFGIGANTMTVLASINGKTISAEITLGWNHIVQTYDGLNQKLYVNGELKVAQPLNGTITQSSYDLFIGDLIGFNGTIDEVRIYNRSLNAEEIKAHYERRKYTSPDPTVIIGLEKVYEKYLPFGTFISSVFESGAYGAIWNTISWIQTLPPETDITIATRSGDILIPDVSWSNWSQELINSLGESISSPRSRYIQYRVTLTTLNTSLTPTLHEVTIDYTLNSVNPPSLIAPSDGNWTSNNNPTFTWIFNDPNLDSKSQFHVEIDDDPLFGSVDYTSGEVISSLEEWTPITLITDGTWYWRVRTTDEYGLWSDWSENWSINIDTTAPTQPTDVAAEPDTWTNINSFTVNWTDPSDFSGVKPGTWYKIGSPPTSNSDGTWLATKPITVTSFEGQQTIYIWLEDNLGNVDYQNNTSTILYLDTTPPSDPINLGAVPDSWTGSNSFSINWTNPLDDSGVKIGAWYKIGGSPTSSSDGIWTDTKPFSVTSFEGQQSIYVWLEDNVGNVDYMNNASVILYLDTTPPEPFTPIADPSNWTTNNQPVITFSTTDSASGMSHYEVKIDNGSFNPGTSPYTLPPQTDGIHTVTVRAYDNVGNYRESIVKVYIDTTPPEPFTPAADPSGWTSNNQPIITFSTTDSGSGINHYEVRVDNGSFLPQTSPYTLPPQTDGTHIVIIRAYDNAGNHREGIVEIYIDTTPPLAPSEIGATPISWTKLNSFVINWTNPTETDTSGIKTGTWYKIGSPPTSNSDGTWIGEKPFIVTSQEGEQIIYIWLEDNIGNVDYNNYGTTTLYLDTTPPGPPTNVTASPSSWTISNSFNIDWVNPSDDSGVKTGAYYKIDSPPTSDSDGTWLGQKPITVTTTEGETVIYIWLEDNLENRDYQNYGFTNLYLDSNAPSITHTPVTNAKKGEAITISATVTDNVRVKTVTLHYKKQGDENFEQVTMVKDGDVYSADIPSSFVTKQNIEYYISASDEINTATYPSSGATTGYLPIEIKDEDVLFIPSWLWLLLVLLVILVLIVLFMSRRRGEEEVGAIAEEEPQPELYEESELPEEESGIAALEEEREVGIITEEQPQLPEEESVIAEGEEEAGTTPLAPRPDAIPSPTQELSDDEIFENIKKKYEEGKISEETFQDFKKRYGKE